MDATLRRCLTLLTTALNGRAGEIWLRSGEKRDVELRYSASDGAPGVVAFEAQGKALGLGAGPTLVSRVVKSGRGSTITSMSGNGSAERTEEAAAADIHTALTFPIRGRHAVVGVLAIYREAIDRSHRDALAALPTICQHLGRFIERVRAERVVHDAAIELAAIASTNSLTGLKNRREFDRAVRTIPRLPFAVLSLDVDRLKEINDTDGHAAGDALLRLVGTYPRIAGPRMGRDGPGRRRRIRCSAS